MAPEQARGKSIDHRADLFSVGIVMWELIAGRHLIHAATTVVSVERLLYGDLLSLSAVVPDIDPEMFQAVDGRIFHELSPKRKQKARERSAEGFERLGLQQVRGARRLRVKSGTGDETSLSRANVATAPARILSGRCHASRWPAQPPLACRRHLFVDRSSNTPRSPLSAHGACPRTERVRNA